jgi:hypothetical protein
LIEAVKGKLPRDLHNGLSDKDLTKTLAADARALLAGESP